MRILSQTRPRRWSVLFAGALLRRFYTSGPLEPVVEALMVSIRRHNPVALKVNPSTPRKRGGNNNVVIKKRPPPSPRQSFISQRIQKYLDKTGIKKSNFGRTVMSDTTFVSRLTDGTVMKDHTLDKVEAWLDDWDMRNGR